MLKPIEILLAIMEKLRSEEGCAWDREQTHESLKSGLIEECYEVVEAIDGGDAGALREELGDLLLHVVFHSQIAAEKGEFSWEDVCRSIMHKMIARHPHVFLPFPTADGSVEMSQVNGTAEILSQWERIKSREKKERASILDGVSPSLPSLSRAQKMQSKAARLGFDWADAQGPRDKVDEELREVEAAMGSENLEDELGDVLFAVVNWCRKLGVDAECALMKANRKFEGRFRKMEKMGLEGKLPEEMDKLWEQVKSDESKAEVV